MNDVFCVRHRARVVYRPLIWATGRLACCCGWDLRWDVDGVDDVAARRVVQPRVVMGSS